MTRPNHHRIGRQVIELAVGAGSDGPAVHRELGRPFWDRAVSELEPVFDGAAGPQELLRVDRLEIDLGRIDGADWPAEFRRKLVAELTRHLARFAAASEAGDGNARREPLPLEPWRQFLFFLVHGRLPWWAPTPGERWNAALSNGSEAAWNALRETLAADPRARSRFVY
jgi:contractile injection system tape measure protein